MAPGKDADPRNSELMEDLRRVAAEVDREDKDAAEQSARELFQSRKSGGSK